MSSQPPRGVRSSTQTGRDIHRPDPNRAPDERVAPACTTTLKAERARWLLIPEVTSGRLAFADLCTNCFPDLGGPHECTLCGAAMVRERTVPVDGRYEALFSCEACDGRGRIAVDAASGELAFRRGAVGPRRRVLPDGGIESAGKYSQLPSGSTGLETGSRLVSEDDGSVWKVVGHDDYDGLPIVLKVEEGGHVAS